MKNTRNFFGKTFYSHGVMEKSKAQEYAEKAKAAGFSTILTKKQNNSLEIYIK